MKRFFIIVSFIFALALPRANVFAQDSWATNDSLLRSKNIYEVLLGEGIDSMLRALNMSREYTHIFIDTPNATMHSIQSMRGTGKFDSLKRNLFVKTFLYFHSTLRNSENGEEGIYSINVEGMINNIIVTSPDQNFSFTRSRRYLTRYENTPADAHSFWDTAKPILVTIGAAAVIALFFLVRG